MTTEKVIPAMFREYAPFIATVAVLLACWLLTAWLAPSAVWLAFGVFASAFVALAVGAGSAWALWHGAA